MRIILYTGKGGVGKTSIAAATGVSLADKGLRTLVISTDAAHSLTDCFNVQLSNDPVQVSDYLWGVEIDSLKETERNWGSVLKWFQGVIQWADLNDMSSEEMIIFPGMEELFSLLKVKEYVKSKAYDVVIIDCAPTGETLRLLSYPNIMKWWLQKIFPYERQLVRAIKPVAKVVTGGLELPDNNTMNSIERLGTELEEMHRLIFQPKTTTVRIVVNPEKMVIEEARRSFTYLNLFGFNTDAIVVNKILPKEAGIGFFQDWMIRHDEYMNEIEATFSPLPIIKIPLMKEEVIGVDSLKKVGKVAFSNIDIGNILFEDKIEEIIKLQDHYLLKLRLPFITKDDIDMTQRGDELTIIVGMYKKKLILPRNLIGRPVTSAKLEDDRLVISFGERSL